MTDQDEIIVRTAVESDSKYSQEIVDEMASSAKARGTGIAKRSPEYVSNSVFVFQYDSDRLHHDGGNQDRTRQTGRGGSRVHCLPGVYAECVFP